MSEHAPTPWTYERTIIRDESGRLVAAAECADWVNAAHIVRCVNAHDDLLEACRSQLAHNGHLFDCNASQAKDRQMNLEPRCIASCRASRNAIAKATQNSGDAKTNNSSDDQSGNRRLLAARVYALKSWEDRELHALNLAVSLRGCVPDSNCAYKPARAEGLIDRGGCPHDKHGLLAALAIVINNQESA